ncbi:hypothetical protein KY361_04100 [Candidatus Woesearchaeota archaeon]|nr:hypothetical protein [Candidatus Woesearchaeota archaeon]
MNIKDKLGKRIVLDREKRIYLSLAVIGVAVIFAFFLVIKPAIEGFVVSGREYSYTEDIELAFNESAEYLWYPENPGKLSSIKITGSLAGSAKVYLEHEGERYLIYDKYQEGVEGITGFAVSLGNETNQSIINETINQTSTNESIEINQTIINETFGNGTFPNGLETNVSKTLNQTEEIVINQTLEFNETQINESIKELNQSIINESIELNQTLINETVQVNETLNETVEEEPEKKIEIELEYNSGTNFDPDDNGIEDIDGVIDFIIKEATFNFRINESSLCSRWGVYSEENKESTIICHGYDDCCKFVGVLSYQPEWNDEFYLSYGRHGATYNNIVSAEVIYYDDTSTALDIQASYPATLKAIFRPYFVEFEDICLETCKLVNVGRKPYKLIFELENGSSLKIEKITYSMILVNKAPVFSHIPNQKITKDEVITINLSEYASDPDNDDLTFSYYQPKDINVSIDGDIATIIPINLTTIRFMFFTANDSDRTAISNVFKIELIEPKKLRISPEIKDAKGNLVRANVTFLDGKTKELKLKRETGELGIAIAEAPELEEGVYDISVEPKKHHVKRIVFKETHLKTNLTELINLDDAPETENFVEIYAIDPTALNFTSANITATAKGSELYKCKDWNFEEQRCYGEWINLMDITPGEEYTFKLTPEDPGYGERIGPVQRGEIDGTGTQIVDTISAINASKAFILFRANTDNSEPDNWQFTPNITNSTTITFDRYSSGVSSAIRWQVVESDELNVQRGTVNLRRGNDQDCKKTGKLEICCHKPPGNPDNPQTICISPTALPAHLAHGDSLGTCDKEGSTNIAINEVDLNNAFVIVYGRCNSRYGEDSNAGFFSAKLTNSTNLLLRRGNDGECAATVSYQVVEWDGAKVQSGTSTILDNSDSAAASINAVELSETFLIFGTASNGTEPGMDSNLIQGNITSQTTLYFTHKPGTTYPDSERLIDWYVVEIPGSYVQSGTTALSSDATETINPVNVSRAFHVSSGWSTGEDETYSNSLYTINLSNSTTLSFDKETDFQTQDIAWYVIDIYKKVEDITPPNIALVIPSNNSKDSNGLVIFGYNVTDLSGIDDCELILNGAVTDVETSITKGIRQQFIKDDLTEGNYSWYINCTDELNYEGSSPIFHFEVDFPGGYTNATIIVNETVLDAQGNFINATIEFIDSYSGRVDHNATSGIVANISSGTFDIKLTFKKSVISSVTFVKTDVTGDVTEIIDIDDVPETARWSELYSLNPILKYNFSSINVSATARTKDLFKCENWSFTERTCKGRWRHLKDIKPGQNYTYVMKNAVDPGFGERNETIMVLGSSDYLVTSNQTVLASDQGILDIEIIPFEEVDDTISRVILYGHDILSDDNNLRMDDSIVLDMYGKSYSVDPTLLNFTNATITVTANSTRLFKCLNWSPENQTCYGAWELFKTGLVPGQTYNFTLTPNDPAFGESQIGDCSAEDNAASAGLWNSICDNPYPGTALFYDDTTYETHTLTKGGNTWAGLRINSTNTSVTDCVSIVEVYFCYKWWAATTRTQSCDISVDADGGASYTAVTTTCPGTTEPGTVTCTDVIPLESWTCDNFGSIGALAKSEAQHSGGGPGDPYEVTWDVFYFNVTYSTVDIVYPTWSNNKTNASDATKTQETVYFNVTLTDDIAGGYRVFSFYNGTNWINDTAEPWTTPQELQEIRTITATRNQTVQWYWRFNDSYGNINQTDVWSFTVANTPPILTTNPSINNTAPKTNDTINCDAGTYYDADNDPESTRYWQWYENNVTIAGQTAQTLDLNLAGLTKGDVIICSEKTSDGYDNNSGYNSTSVTIQNTPPIILWIIPNQTVNNGMTWSYDANATDPDVGEGIDTLTWDDNTTLFDINSATGIFSDTPTEADAGVYETRINVSDGTAQDAQSFIYTINDITPPNITLEYPPDGFSYDLAPNYEVTFNCSAADGHNLKNISLWMTDSSNQLFDLAESSIITGTYNYSTWTLDLTKGNYTWNCLVYDEYDNYDWGSNRSIKINFTFDLILPAINWISDYPDPVNRSDNITILANVTDNLGIDSVLVDIEGTNYTMLPQAYIGGVAQAFFDGFETGTLTTNNWTTAGAGAPWVVSTIAPYLGTYDARTENTNGESILQNIIDTTDYVNVTLSFYYETNNLDGGEYFAADWYNGTAWINVVTIEDTAGWTLYNSTLPSSADDNVDFRVRFRCSSNNNNEECKVDNVEVTGNQRTYTEVYETSYNTSELDKGTYNYTVYARDIYENDAIPWTGNFTVIWIDYTPPNVFAITPEANSSYNFLANIQIGANVTDDGFIDNVKANITYPNGTLQQLDLSLSVGDRYNTSFTVPMVAGRYNVTFIATDTGNNTNSSETTYFIAFYLDVTPPTSNSPPDQYVDVGEDASINWILQDNNDSGYYYVERNGQLFKEQTPWTNDVPNIVKPNTYFLGTWNYTIFYNDSAGNDGIPDTVFVTVADVTVPSCDEIEGDTPTLVNITVDGNMDEWDSVLANPLNHIFDLTEGAGDGDTGMTADRDLVEFAYTWNDQQLYFYFRRLNGGTKKLTALVYLDYDNDGFMNATDQVLVFAWWGTNQKYDSDLYNYIPAGTADQLNGSGYDMPGSISINKSLESQVVGGGSSGIELETRVNWADLGFPGPTAVNLKAAASLGINVPAQLQDNLDTISSVYALLLFQPNHEASARNGTSVYYYHDLMNCGILEEVIELVNQSTQGFEITLYYPNGTIITDTDGDNKPDITLGVENFTTLIVKIDVPGTASIGTVDTTTITATSSVDDTVSETVTDTTTIGAIAIAPASRTISGAQGITAVFNYTVSNAQSISDVLEISAVSDHGWNVTLYYSNGTLLTDTDGDSHSDIGSLLPSESRGIQAKIKIPSNETIGTIDLTTLRINSSNDPGLIAASVINATVRERLTIATDYDRSVGIGDSTYYFLTITNSWSESDTIDITYTFVRNWSTDFFDSDRTSLLTDTDSDGLIDIGALGAYGEQHDIYVKVTVPPDATEYDVETTSIYVNSSLNTAVFDIVIINTTARRVITYADSARTTERTIFEVGDTVYTRAHRLTGVTNVYYQWIDSNNTVVRISPSIPVSAADNADDMLKTSASYLLGYNWTVVVFNAQGDIEIGRANFDLLDTIPPDVTVTAPTAGSLFNISDIIEISANVTDYVGVDSVYVNITFPNGTAKYLNLNYTLNKKYNTSFTVPNLPGQYNVRFIANDTSGNVDGAKTTYFIVGEYYPPKVFNITPARNSTFNVSQQIEVGANVTDNVAVGNVYANISIPNGTIQTLTLSRVGLTDRYNISYTIHGYAGRYNITFIAYDTSGNVNGSETTYFYAVDNFYPSVFDLIPKAGSQFSGGEYIEVGANVTDNGVITYVLANITYPNGTTYPLTLNPAVGDKYNNSFYIPYLKGRYNITIIASDASGLVNDSEWTYFYVINLLPTHDYPILNSTFGKNSTKDNLTVHPQNVIDLDGDNVTTIADWRLENTSIAVINMHFDSNLSNYTYTIRDYSTFENHGAIGGGNYSQRPEWTTGTIGGAYRFDGIDDYIDIGNKADFNQAQSFTIEAWINKAVNATTIERIISKKDGDAADPGYQLAVTPQQTLEARIADGTNLVIKNSTTTITPGTWYHVTIAVDRTSQQLQLYINGQAQGSPVNITPTSLNPSNTRPLTIGASSNQSGFFNGTIDEVRIYTRPLSQEQLAANFAAGNQGNNYHTLAWPETDQGENWTAAITPNDGYGDGITKVSNRVTILVNQEPTAPILFSPYNNASIVDRTPTFIWNNSYDADGDPLVYELLVDNNASFNSPEIDVDNIPEAPTQTNYTSASELDVDKVYYWRVRAYDNKTYGNWSTVFYFTLESYAAISLITDTVNFYTVIPSYTDNTTDNNPPPFLLENQGNIDLNITLTGTRMFTKGTFPGDNFQFKIDANESNSFDYSPSTTDWTNITNESSRVDIVSLDWHDISDTSEGDILIRVPDDEPPGARNSTVTFSVI